MHVFIWCFSRPSNGQSNFMCVIWKVRNFLGQFAYLEKMRRSQTSEFASSLFKPNFLFWIDYVPPIPGIIMTLFLLFSVAVLSRYIVSSSRHLPGHFIFLIERRVFRVFVCPESLLRVNVSGGASELSLVVRDKLAILTASFFFNRFGNILVTPLIAFPSVCYESLCSVHPTTFGTAWEKVPIIRKTLYICDKNCILSKGIRLNSIVRQLINSK